MTAPTKLTPQQRATTSYTIKNSGNWDAQREQLNRILSNIDSRIEGLAAAPISSGSSSGSTFNASQFTVAGDMVSISEDGVTGLEIDFTSFNTDSITEGVANLYFTDERAQDAIGLIVDTTLLYNDGTPSLGINLGNANSWTATQTFVDAIIGDPGSESSGINVNGTVYPAVLKVSDIGGTNEALIHIHRHSDTYTPTLVFSRSKGDTSSHSVVTNGDILAEHVHCGWTGSHYDRSSEVEYAVDDTGTVSATSLPGKITFKVSADGTTNPTTALILRNTKNAEFYADVDIAGALSATSTATVGGDIIGTASNLIIRRDTSDGADSGASFLAGGGAVSVSRGGLIAVYGNEHANAGAVVLNAGDAGGTVKLQLNGTTRIEATSTGGTITGALNCTGNITSTGSKITLGSDTTYDLNVRTAATAGTNAVANLIAGNTAISALYFSDTDANARGRWSYQHSDDTLHGFAGGVDRFTLSSSGLAVTLALSCTGNFTAGDASTDTHTINGNITNVNGVLYTGIITPTQLTANTDNWAPTSFSACYAIRASTDASRNLTGIAGGASGRKILLMNVGAQDLVLVHDATSTAANRFYCPGSANLTLNANDSVYLWYDGTSARWRVIGV